jgi:aryl-alcohol dehydrogenase-like predicted oxidoreductase
MLEQIELPGTGRGTTRLGFGGSGLMGGLSERESLLLLETAYEAGIRHFDVAPSYGHGLAERCVRKFLRGKSDQATVATKYGILAPPQTSILDAARRVLRPVVRHLPAVRKRVARAAAGMKTKARFSTEEAQRSLEHSLRELGVERVDLWLLHEVTAEDLDGSDLLPVLQEMQQQGRIGIYGVGSERGLLDTIWERHREYCPSVQFGWSVLDAKAQFPGAFRIHHRAVSSAYGALREHFEHAPALCQRWSNAVDADLSQPEILASMLLQASLAANPNSIVLFSSRVPAHIRSNVRSFEDPSWMLRGQRFCELVAGEFHGIR